MTDVESSNESSRGVFRRRPDRPGWTVIGVSAFLVLAVSVPTLAVEEDWHGSPMIDQPSLLWIIAASVVAATFFVGGAVAGYRRPCAAVTHATAAAGLTVAVLLVCAVSRRLWLAHEVVPIAVAWLWCFGAVAALLLSAAGSLLGRRLTTGTR